MRCGWAGVKRAFDDSAVTSATAGPLPVGMAASSPVGPGAAGAVHEVERDPDPVPAVDHADADPVVGADDVGVVARGLWKAPWSDATSPPTPMFSAPWVQLGSTAVSDGPRSGRWHSADRLQSVGAAGSVAMPPLAAKTADMWPDQARAMLSRPASRVRGGSPASARAWLVRTRNWASAVPGSGTADAEEAVVRRPTAARLAATRSALIQRRQCTARGIGAVGAPT